MRRKPRTKRGRDRYALRMERVEPVFGQIKQGRGFRQFLLRGLEKVNREWLPICTGYNLLKLFRFGAAGPGKARRNSSGREAKESPLASRLSRDSQSSCICDRQAWLSSTAHPGCSPIPARQSLDGLLGLSLNTTAAIAFALAPMRSATRYIGG